MNAKKIVMLALAAILALALAIPAVASAPAKAPQVLQGIIIEWADGQGKGAPEGKGKPPPKEEPAKDNAHYELLGPAWDLTKYSGGIPYLLEETWAPEGSSAAIIAAYETWDAAVTAELFDDIPLVTTEPLANPVAYDEVNTVTWRRWLPRGIVAFAAYWYLDNDGSGTPTLGDEMLEVDISFNLFHPWSVSPDKKAFDVGNVATHEVGHKVGLADLYDEVYSELTMYGYVAKGETKKTTLEEGDISGTRFLYGN